MASDEYNKIPKGVHRKLREIENSSENGDSLPA